MNDFMTPPKHVNFRAKKLFNSIEGKLMMVLLPTWNSTEEGL